MRIFLLFVLFLGFLKCYPQRFLDFSWYTKHDGLSDNFITDITEDSLGRIWFTSFYGISHFNGTSFSTYLLEDSIPHKLIRNDILCNYTDSKGHIWFGSFNGTVMKYNQTKDCFEDYSLTLKTSNEYPAIYDITESSDGEIMLFTQRGLYKYNTVYNGFVRVLRSIPKKIENDITTLFVYSNDISIIGTSSNGLIIHSEKDKTVDEISFHDTLGVQPYINKIIFLTDSTFLIGSSLGLFSFNIHDRSVRSIYPELKWSFIKDISKDNKGNIWVATTSKGLWLIEANNNIINIECNGITLKTIKSVNKIFCDTRGRMWFASQGNGAFFYNPENDVIKKITTSNGLSHNIVSAITHDKNGRLWVGTDGGGIDIFNDDLTLFKSIEESSGLYTNLILGFTPVGNTMWCSTWYGGLLGLDINSFSVKQYTNFNSGLESAGIKSTCRYGKDSILVSTHERGLFKLDLTSNTISAFKPEYNYSGFVDEHLFVNQVKVDQNGVIWVATIRNLYCIKNGVAKEILVNDSTYSPQLPLFVTTICDTKDGYLLAGTNTGLFRVNLETFETEDFSKYIPFLSNTKILTVYASTDGVYWLATTKGLYKYYPETKIYEKVLVGENAQGLYFTERAVYEDNKGILYWGTNEGLLMFDPHKVKKDNTIQKLYFSDLYLSNNIVYPGSEDLPQSLIFKDTLIIDHEHRRWGVTYNSVCYSFPEEIEYAYMLEGYDKTWINLGNKREISFINIPQGTYKLVVKASKNNSSYEYKKALTVIIKPAWWNTLFFKIVFLIGILVIVYLIYHIRLESLTKQKLSLKKEVAEKTNVLSSQNEQIEKQNAVLRKFTAQQEKSNNLLRKQKIELEKLSEKLQDESEELSIVNEKLQQTSETKNQLFSIITHDVRNSFISIQATSEKLKNEVKKIDNGRLRKLSDTIASAVTNTSDLLTNLLYWAKSQSTSIESKPEILNPAEIIQQVLDMYSHFSSEKNISINYSDDNASEIFADREMVVTALRNLVNNALKFSPKGGFMLLSTRNKGNMVEFMIRDSGNGIDSDLIQTLFEIEPHDIKNLHATHHESGLGLVISRQFVEKNKGSMSLKSTKNNGTTFVVELPIAQKKEKQTLEESKQGKTTHSTTVCIVDDNSTVADMIGEYFWDNAQTHIFDSGFDLLEYLKENTTDLIISDILMPGIDGYSLCNQLKKNPSYSSIPIILISSKQDNATKEQAYKSGADAFMEKPLVKTVLLALVDRLVANSKQHNFQGIVMKNSSDESGFTKTFEKLLKENISNQNYSIEDMANDCNMSRSQLFRKVKQYYSISPKDYMIKIRMQAAAELLKQEDTKIINIAYSTGFSDPSYFSRCFTKHYGITPSEYKDSYLKSNR